MKRNLLLIAALGIVLFTSCKKENEQPAENVTPVAPNERLLLNYSYAYGVYNFTYNADKTLKGYSWSNGNAQAIFTYQPNKLIATFTFNGVKTDEREYELKDGIAQKVTGRSYSNGSLTDTYVTVCTYNADKLLVKYQFYKNGDPNGSIDRTYNAEGDMILAQTKDANGVVTRTSSYEYDLSLLDKSGSWGQSETNGAGSVFPKMAKYMIKKQTVQENNTTTVYNFSYTTDAQGYVVSGVIKDGSMITLDTWTNTWQ